MAPGSSHAEVSAPEDEDSRRIQLRRRLFVALVTPVALLLTAGAILATQLQRVTNDAWWLDHTDEVLAKAWELERQLVDQESALRGLAITGEDSFLENYRKARPRALLEQLRVLVSDNPGQEARLDLLQNRYDYWLSTIADPALRDPVLGRNTASMLEGKKRMEELRATMRDFKDHELDLRRERAELSAASQSNARVVLVGLLLGVAASLVFLSRRQLEGIARASGDMIRGEREARAATDREHWIRLGQTKIGDSMLGDEPSEVLADRVLKAVAAYVSADVGVFFTADAEGWRRRAGYGLDMTAAPERFARNEGVVGRAAAETRVVHLRDVPEDFLRVRSGTGERAPVEIVLVPAVADDVVNAVVELGFLRTLEGPALTLLSRIGQPIGLAMRAATYRQRLRELLEEAQQKTEELQAQQEELRAANEELEAQTSAVNDAHAKLEGRQMDLELANARLVENAFKLRSSQEGFQQKALEADRASRYKSEFLANMSHELRTPLNSTLILAKLLADNAKGNLTEEQVDFARTIYASGNDLLALIDDVLDLSKVESGHAEVRTTVVSVRELTLALSRTFEPVAAHKHLHFTLAEEGDAPIQLETDPIRLEQILKNLLANAFKFTDVGSVSVRIATRGPSVVFEVADTGIGIPEDQHSTIFEPFRQVDGTSQRRYGGTGLGLSIAREHARLLHGTLGVESEPEKGSVFRLVLPRALAGAGEVAPPTLPAPLATVTARANGASPQGTRALLSPGAFADDRDALDPNRSLLLVIEDDVAFAHILFDLAHERKMQCIVAHDAATGAFLAAKCVPSAIVLDIHLPDHTGLYVLDRLKHDPATRHLPVHVVSGTGLSKEALSMGAVGYLEKPVTREALGAAFADIEARVSRRIRRLLIVESDDRQREALTKLMTDADVEIVAAATVGDALAELRAQSFDCVVTELAPKDDAGVDLLEQMAGDDGYSFPPVIVYTARKLDAAEEQRLRNYSNSIIVKGVRSPERLLDEVSLFLHQVESEFPPAKRQMIQKSRDREAPFDGKTILVVEDDIRNVFALSKILEPKGARVVIARNGREAIEALERTPSIDLVLMDVMMPEMDGLEATRAIRERPAWAKTPILALTAKAMPDDREKCLQAGANDYVSKPINVEMLLSLIRVWMSR
jgi:signal transduction histidine kinase/CheY-like chemotaxis protein/CHASE3 domain sensor protein